LGHIFFKFKELVWSGPQPLPDPIIVNQTAQPLTFWRLYNGMVFPEGADKKPPKGLLIILEAFVFLKAVETLSLPGPIEPVSL